MSPIQTLLAFTAATMLAQSPSAAGAPVGENNGPSQDILCKDCEQSLAVDVRTLDDKLERQLQWSGPYIVGGLEPEFTCEEGTYYEESWLAADDYDVSNTAHCSFSPWPDPYNTGLYPYDGACGGVSDQQIDLALYYSGVWNHAEITRDETVRIPVDYRTMSEVLLGNADPVDWAFTCSLWFNGQFEYTVASGSSNGFVNTNSYLGISVPRFPALCQNRQFVVRAPEQASVRVYSVRITRRLCDPNTGEPEEFRP